MKKEYIIEKILAIIILGVIVAGGVNYYQKKYGEKETEAWYGFNSKYEIEFKDIPVYIDKNYEIEILGNTYLGELEHVYSTSDYKENVCEYVCEDGTIIWCTYEEKLEFLSILLKQPIKLSESFSEEYIEKIMSSYINDTKNYKYMKEKQEDNYVYRYVRYYQDLETNEELAITANDKGYIYKVLYYQADELNDICVVADEIQAAEDTLKRNLLEIYGQDVKYEVERSKFSVVSNKGWRICYSVVINQDKMPLDSVVTCSHVYVDECEC